MRIAVVGAGGVGGYFGARLAVGGADVAFLARGAHLAALRRDGLRIEGGPHAIVLPNVTASDSPQDIGPADVVVMAVKLWDTEAVARSIGALVGPNTAVLSLQNGVQKDDILASVFGAGRVLGGLCYIAAVIEAPGVIRHTGTMQRVVFGELDGSRSARAEAFLDACRRGAIDVELSGDITRAIWEKFVFLVGLSATTSTIGTSIGPIRSNPQSRAFLLDVMREVVAVGRAHGVALPSDYAEQRLVFCDGLPEQMTSSMHNDLRQGNRLEVPWLSGAVVELGKAAGVPTPLNRAVSDILALAAPGKRA